MSQHFTKNTVSAQFYCSKCGKMTSHRIDEGRKGPCLPCMEKPIVKRAPAAVQGGLFASEQAAIEGYKEGM